MPIDGWMILNLVAVLSRLCSVYELQLTTFATCAGSLPRQNHASVILTIGSHHIASIVSKKESGTSRSVGRKIRSRIATSCWLDQDAKQNKVPLHKIPSGREASCLHTLLCRSRTALLTRGIAIGVRLTSTSLVSRGCTPAHLPLVCMLAHWACHVHDR